MTATDAGLAARDTQPHLNDAGPLLRDARHDHLPPHPEHGHGSAVRAIDRES